MRYLLFFLITVFSYGIPGGSSSTSCNDLYPLAQSIIPNDPINNYSRTPDIDNLNAWIAQPAYRGTCFRNSSIDPENPNATYQEWTRYLHNPDYDIYIGDVLYYGKAFETYYLVVLNDSYTPSTSCPDNATYNELKEKCVCNPSYYETYDLLDGMTCTLPECNEEMNGLNLFAVVTNVSQCNFFPYSDNLYVGDDTFGCCYGTQNDIPDGCPSNTISVGDKGCLPIDNNPDSDSPPPDITCPLGQYFSYATGQCELLIETDNLDNSCPTGQYFDLSAGLCLDVPENLDNNGTDKQPDGNYPYSDSNGTISGGAGDADGDGVDDIYNDALTGVEDSLMGVLNSYVLIHAPFNATGVCSSELSKTVSIMGVSYTINLAPYVSMMNEYIPVIRSIVLFMFALSGILLVLAGRGE